MRIDLIIFWCAVGLIVLVATLSIVFLFGYKKGIQYMADLFKLIYEEEQRRENHE